MGLPAAPALRLSSEPNSIETTRGVTRMDVGAVLAPVSARSAVLRPICGSIWAGKRSRLATRIAAAFAKRDLSLKMTPRTGLAPAGTVRTTTLPAAASAVGQVLESAFVPA